MEDMNVEDKKYKININSFEGPLDLLCFLVSKNKMDIFDISLSSLTDQYLEYLSNMQNLNMEIATEFLVMASNLLYIKSKKLLPNIVEEDDVNCEITEEELLEKISNYKKYKNKQELLRTMYYENFGTFEKMPEKLKVKVNLENMSEINLENILYSYKEILLRIQEKVNIRAKNIEKIAIHEKVTIKSKVKQIMEIFSKKTSFVFSNIFIPDKTNKLDIVTAFLGILELTRLKTAELKQDKIFGEIVVNKISDSQIDISLIKE